MRVDEPISGGAHPALRLLDPRPYASAFRELVALLRRRRRLTYEMARRELSSEHSGKRLGMFWGLFQPLFLLMVYAFIYGVVFKAKIGGTYALPRNFTIYLLAGLVPWFAFQLAMAKATTVITANSSLVKQVVFDLDVLPVASTVTACLSLTIGVAFVTLFTLATYGALPATYLLLPVLLIVWGLAVIGVAYVLAALGTFVRDVRDLVQLSGVVLIFLMPIVFLPTSVPKAFEPLFAVNPFTYMVFCFQDVLYFGRLEHPASWVVFPLWSLVVFVGGYRLFRRSRPLFANVL